MTPMAQQRTDLARLAGAAHRMAQNPPGIDGEFLGRSGGSVARYIFGTDGNAPESARQLVSAGLISPKDPLAVALQEEQAQKSAIEMTDRSSISSGAAELALGVSKSASDRDVMVGAAALRRRIATGKMSPEALALGFENVSRTAQSAGDAAAMSGAAKAFATMSIAGVAERDRVRAAPRRSSDREID